MSDNVHELSKTIKQEAEAEFAKEQHERAKQMMKSVLRRRAAAELVLKNIDREIEDLEHRIAQGDVD